MKPIGGFFELETARGAQELHKRAIALTSGRAALAVILEQLRPTKVLVPFYVCDSVLAPIASAGIAIEYYALTETFEPDLPRNAAAGECMIYVNYFGLKSSAAQRIAALLGSACVIDDTHAFFCAGYDRAWSFNSVRKVFGVPDGAYLYAPVAIRGEFIPNPEVSAEHLINRLLGHLDLAWRQYREREQQITSEPRGMSIVSKSLLAGVDCVAAGSARRSNYAELHSLLGHLNELPAPVLTLGDSAVPFCYPLLADRDGVHEALWSRDIFAPRLWPEVLERTQQGFERERAFATRLLPLPIDHRYNADDMARIAAAVTQVLQ